jgi:hypothetical protein
VETNVLDRSHVGEKSATLCSMKSSKMDLAKLKELWVERINFFRNKCV